jgi:PKD repeat protein
MTWTQSSVGLPNTRSSGITAADVDEDGLIDLVLSAIEAGPGGGVYVYQNTRDASLWRSMSTGLPTSGDYVENDVADIDGDGNLDIAATGGFATTYGLHVFLGDGEGTWSERSTGLPEDAYYVGCKLGDFNKDGHPDIVAGKRSEGSGVEVWKNLWGIDMPTITLIAPGDGTSWTGGSEHQLRWSVTGGTPPYTIDLNYSSDGGATFPNIISSGLTRSVPGPMWLNWTVPRIDSGTVRILVEVTDAGGLTVSESSVTDFEIDSTTPHVLMVTPGNGTRGNPADAQVAIGFDEGMGISTTTAVAISGPGGPALTQPSVAGESVSFKAAGLELNSAYIITVSTAATDDSDPGNTLAGEHWFTFTTRAGALDSPPVARAGPDQTIDQHEPLTFDGSASTDDAGIMNWTWRFIYEDRVVLLYGPTPTFTFDDVGEVEVMLMVTDGDDLTTSDQVFVTILDSEPPVAVTGEDKEIDQHHKVVLDGEGSTDNVAIVFYEWTFDYDGSLTTLSGPTHVFDFDIAGAYTITLTVGDGAGNTDEESFNVTVRDVDPPVAIPGDDRSIREGKTITLNGSASTDNVGIESWEWRIERKGKVTSLSGPVVNHRFTKAGTYYVNLTVGDASGLHASDGYYVTVNEKDPGPGFQLGFVVLAILGVVVIARGRRTRRALR